MRKVIVKIRILYVSRAPSGFHFVHFDEVNFKVLLSEGLHLSLCFQFANLYFCFRIKLFLPQFLNFQNILWPHLLLNTLLPQQILSLRNIVQTHLKVAYTDLSAFSWFLYCFALNPLRFPKRPRTGSAFFPNLFTLILFGCQNASCALLGNRRARIVGTFTRSIIWIWVFHFFNSKYLLV